MADISDNIKIILDRVLGSPKRDESGSGGWYEYNCLMCAEENMGQPDGKFNLAVNPDQDEFYCHCWRCGYSPSLYKLIKTHGTREDIDDFKEEVRALKEKKLYTMSDEFADVDDNLFVDDSVKLPKGFKKINEEDRNAIEAIKYLEGRGIGKKTIESMKIGYIGSYNGKYSNRVVIPSYDEFGNLNYWVARDYTGKAKVKIYNPDIDKKSICFGEGYVNWYEPITLVEGPFDHIAVPNSIPLLGKTLDEECLVFHRIEEMSKSRINVFLDDDAVDSARKIYAFLDSKFPGKIRIIDCPDGYDAADWFRCFGPGGIAKLLGNAHKLDRYLVDKFNL